MPWMTSSRYRSATGRFSKAWGQGKRSYRDYFSAHYYPLIEDRIPGSPPLVTRAKLLRAMDK